MSGKRVVEGVRPLQLVDWLGISRSKYYDWRERYGKANEHNRLIPRDHWLQDWEHRAIIDFHHKFPLEGYRRLTLMPSPPGCGTLRAAFGSLSRGIPASRLMMLDHDIVASAPQVLQHRAPAHRHRLHHSPGQTS